MKTIKRDVGDIELFGSNIKNAYIYICINAAIRKYDLLWQIRITRRGIHIVQWVALAQDCKLLRARR